MPSRSLTLNMHGFARSTDSRSSCNILGMKKKALSCGLILISWMVTAAAGDIPADLAKAVHDYDQAQIKGDRSQLQRLLADDYVLWNSAGRVEDKAKLIADYTAPGFKIEPFVVREPIEHVGQAKREVASHLHARRASALAPQRRVEQRKQGSPVTFSFGGVIRRYISEHPAVFGVIGLDLVVDTGGAQRMFKPFLHIVGK